MKKLLAIVLTVFSMSIYAGSLEMSPAPDVMLNAGVTSVGLLSLSFPQLKRKPLVV